MREEASEEGVEGDGVVERSPLFSIYTRIRTHIQWVDLGGWLSGVIGL